MKLLYLGVLAHQKESSFENSLCMVVFALSIISICLVTVFWMSHWFAVKKFNEVAKNVIFALMSWEESAF